MKLKKIISGGQTGADRAAMDVALELNIDCGGYCPAGRIAEDGVIPEKYPLKELQSKDYNDRTRKNIETSDATLLISLTDKIDQGSELTRSYSIQLEKLFLHIAAEKDKAAADKITAWLRENDIETLNIAGPRESNDPGVYDFTKNLLIKVLL